MARLGVFQTSRHIVRDMASRPKILFLLEGFAETVIESQVLANVRLIQDQNIATYEIWAFTFPNAKFKISQQRLAAAQDLAQAPITWCTAGPCSSMLVHVLAWQTMQDHARQLQSMLGHCVECQTMACPCSTMACQCRPWLAHARPC